jgi:Domain of unknown function (DUF4276)
VNELRIYFEGDDRLRPGVRLFFSQLAEAARRKGWRFAPPVATYGRPVQAFRIALQTHSEAWNVLLLDWEDPNESEVRKKHLEHCDPDSVFWMVQVMEAWFLADVEALRALYKRRFNEGALGWNTKVEEIPKVDVLERLKRVSGGEYHKVNHGAKLLELIDPERVRKAAPNCDRMFRLILARLG